MSGRRDNSYVRTGRICSWRSRACLDPREKLDYFRSVSRVPGMRMLEQKWVGSRCALFNSQTGLLPCASGNHAQDPLTRTHLFLEGEILNAEDLAKTAAAFTGIREMRALFSKTWSSFLSNEALHFYFFSKGNLRLPFMKNAIVFIFSPIICQRNPFSILSITKDCFLDLKRKASWPHAPQVFLWIRSGFFNFWLCTITWRIEHLFLESST